MINVHTLEKRIIMVSVETILGMGGRRVKENNGGSEFTYDIL
jgi:hypothetical protein